MEEVKEVTLDAQSPTTVGNVSVDSGDQEPKSANFKTRSKMRMLRKSRMSVGGSD